MYFCLEMNMCCFWLCEVILSCWNILVKLKCICNNKLFDERNIIKVFILYVKFIVFINWIFKNDINI